MRHPSGARTEDRPLHTEGEREGKKEREEGRGMVGALLNQQIDLHMHVVVVMQQILVCLEGVFSCKTAAF